MEIVPIPEIWNGLSGFFGGTAAAFMDRFQVGAALIGFCVAALAVAVVGIFRKG